MKTEKAILGQQRYGTVKAEKTKNGDSSLTRILQQKLQHLKDDLADAQSDYNSHIQMSKDVQNKIKSIQKEIKLYEDRIAAESKVKNATPNLAKLKKELKDKQAKLKTAKGAEKEKLMKEIMQLESFIDDLENE